MDKILEIEIIKDTQNRLLKRREIEAMLTYEGKTPSKDSVKQEICKKLNLDPTTTIVAKIEQLYGGRKSTSTVRSYENEEAMRIEAKYLFERGKKEGKAKEGERKQEESKVEDKA